MFRSSADIPQAPSSGGHVSELNAMLERRQSGSVTQSPQYQQQSSRNGYGVGRSVLSPRANQAVMRTLSIDSDNVLPMSQNNNDEAPQKPRRATMMRAAETGKGNLLPMRGAGTSVLRQNQQLPQRIQRKPPGRSSSTSSALPRTRQDLGDSKSHKETFLRRRNANASSDDEFDASSQSRIRRNYSGSRRTRHSSGMSVSSTGSYGGANGSSSREHSSSSGWGNGILCERQLIKLSRMKLGHLLQVVIVLAVIALVYESHNKALFATEKLMQFKEEESLLLLHLHQIEEITIHLHENFQRLAEASEDGADGSGGLGASQGDEPRVDYDLLDKQIKQLQHMEKDVSKEVDTLQKRIQRSARGHIIKEFGEGPVQVTLELDFGDSKSNVESNRISILLYQETPHAAWTWLEQIGNNVWDGAEFKWQESHIIDAVPPKNKVDGERDGRIEFIEHPKREEHAPWTVGVRQLPNSNGGRGAMGMYINLQDNSKLHRHETCVGKVIDGFDTLQTLLEKSRNSGNDQSSSRTLPISIRKATAEHYVTKKTVGR